MATVVQRFSEGAYIITADGEEIPIYEGMILEDGDIIVGDVATIEDANAVDPGDDPTSITAEEIAAIQEQILQGADPTQVTDRTAAGAPGAGAFTSDGGGHLFTTLTRTGGEVNPDAGYLTGTFTTPLVQPRDEVPAVLEETPPTETPVDPEPPVEPPVDPEPPVEPPVDPEPPVEPPEPTVVVTKEYREEVDVQTTTETVVGDEYEVDRTTDTVVTEVEQEDGTLKTTTTTTTINYNQETNTITTTVTTTEYYEREITTTTYPNGTEDVVTGEWELVGTQTNTDKSTDTVETPRQEVLVDVQEELIPPPGPENLIPVAEDDIFSTDEDTPINGDVTTNDSESGDGVHHYELVGESIPGLTFNSDGTFEYVPTDVDGDQIITFDYKIVDADGDSDPATVTINVSDVLEPEEPALTETWFISQGGNHVGSDGPTNVDYELVTGATGRHSGDMDLVISNKGLGDYKVQEGDSVTFAFELVHTDAVYGEDYTLDIVSKAPQYDIGEWNLTGNILTVNIIYNGENDFNLAGNTFAIEVTSLIDDGHVNVGFDMTSVTHHDVSAPADVSMTQWETNDDVVIGLNSSSDFIPETRDLPEV